MGYISDIRKKLGHDPIILTGAGVAVINEKNEILLGRRADNGYWAYPAGSMELAESFEECARREVREETGLLLGDLKLLMIRSGKNTYYEYPNQDKVYFAVLIYICFDYSGEMKIQEEEVIEQAFFPIGDLPDNLSPGTVIVIEKVKEYLEKMNKQQGSAKTMISGDDQETGLIRKASAEDISRIAEILVFVKRMNYRSIFQDDAVSFGAIRVLPVAEEYSDPEILKDIWVYKSEGIVKGLIRITDKEVVELYVDHFFQHQGIGAQLIEFAKEKHDVNCLWVLEKNTKAIRFYESHGFHITGNRKLEEGTAEYRVLMER